jgi:chromosome partitioning protein
MRISVIGFKGGVGKTTTAIHLAAYLQKSAPTLLIDGDENRSASEWAARGLLPFKVEDERKAARTGSARDFEHIIIDTQARPAAGELRELAEGSDLLVVPTTPDALSLSALMLTVQGLEAIAGVTYKILLNIIPPPPNRDAEEAREQLRKLKLPVFKAGVRRFIAFQKAALQGVPVYEVSDRRASEAWKDIERVGRELLR